MNRCRRPNVRAGIAWLLPAALCVTAGPAGAAPITWGGEMSFQSDFSTNPSSIDERRGFPLSASIVALVRVGLPGRLRLAGGVGYDQRVKTDHAEFAFDIGVPGSLEAIGQLRERSITWPLTLEVPIGAWSVSPGIEWRHVRETRTRIKWMNVTLDGEAVEYHEHSWRGTDFGTGRRDRWSATLAFARVWRAEGGTRSIGLRWVHGLTDLWDEADREEHRRSLDLVLGWSH